MPFDPVGKGINRNAINNNNNMNVVLVSAIKMFMSIYSITLRNKTK